MLCHRSSAESLREQSGAGCPNQKIGVRLMNGLSKLLKFTGVEPDIVVDEAFDLSEYGMAGTILHTPGHSASSILDLLARTPGKL